MRSDLDGMIDDPCRRRTDCIVHRGGSHNVRSPCAYGSWVMGSSAGIAWYMVAPFLAAKRTGKIANHRTKTAAVEAECRSDAVAINQLWCC
jgi:hypothetical protein